MQQRFVRYFVAYQEILGWEAGWAATCVRLRPLGRGRPRFASEMSLKEDARLKRNIAYAIVTFCSIVAKYFVTIFWTNTRLYATRGIGVARYVPHFVKVDLQWMVLNSRLLGV
jgi:hypothetical protein